MLGGPDCDGTVSLGDKRFFIDAAEFSDTGHAVAGVTCDGDRFVYNGWSENTNDPAQSFANQAKVSRRPELGRPCPLFGFDWLRNTRGFCPDQKCMLENVQGRCFSVTNSTSYIIAVRINDG